MRKTLLIALTSLIVFTSSGQWLDSLEVYTVEWVFPGTRGAIESQEFQQLQSDFNFGEFLNTPQHTYEWKGDFRSTTMSFEFKIISRKQRFENHAISLALRKQVITLDWYNGTRDTLDIELSGQYEFFQMGLGYDYRSVNTRFFKLLSGARIDVGLPVSGFQTESEARTSKFSSDGSNSFTMTAHLIFEFRLFKKTYLKFGPSWAIGFYNFDGFRSWIPQSGLVSGFRFGL